MAYLVLVRHGLSEYNKQGIWAGWDNPPLTPEGIEEAKRAGVHLKDISFQYAYTSDLVRAQQTLHEILTVQNSTAPMTVHKALRERNYGDFTKKNKWKVKEQIGDEEFQKLRRSWDYPVPNGESLKDVYAREIPYFEQEIFSKVKSGKNVIISSSGNALRALVKYLENIPNDEIGELEIGTGEAYVYEINPGGIIINKEIRAENIKKGKV